MSMVKVSELPSKFPWIEGEDYTVIAGDPVMGDPVRVRDATGETFVAYTPITADPILPAPIVLSKTAFNKFGWSQVGMARHQAILEATKNRAGTGDLDYEVRAAYQQYESANTFEKSEVKTLSDLLVAAMIMTGAEQALYMNNWPT